MDRLEKIRQAEARSHITVYTEHELYTAGSWLEKPVKTVLELLPLYDGCGVFRALDLGCGVGRNCIPVAQFFKDAQCFVECVDILPQAIGKLKENARKYGVADSIRGITAAIEEYAVEADNYDLILGISALEHIASAEAFAGKLMQIRNGLRAGGIACLIVNSGVTEHDKQTGDALPPQFEVNLPTKILRQLLRQTFADLQVIKHTVVHQKYDIPRETGLAELETDVVTLVVRRPHGAAWNRGGIS